MKPFKTLDEQIELLRDDRGLIIPDEEYAKKYLLSNNYYNVFNQYGKFFCDKTDKYINGATFSEVTAVHLFDKEIKSDFLKAILEAEKHFKSVVAYRFSEKFKKPYSYLNIENFVTKSATDLSNVTYLISKIATIIDKKCNKRASENSIKHYQNKHHEVPFWVVVGYFDFGTIFNFYKYLDEGLRDKIANDLVSFLKSNISNIRQEEKIVHISGKMLLSALSNILEFRNVTAHNNKMFSYKCRESITHHDILFSHYNILKNTPKQDLYTTFLTLQLFLSANEYAQLHNALLKRFKLLSNRLTSIDYNTITAQLGFPKDWHKIKPLPQT
ncbi:TPA: Abi family protein [Streptococcus suis]